MSYKGVDSLVPVIALQRLMGQVTFSQPGEDMVIDCRYLDVTGEV